MTGGQRMRVLRGKLQAATKPVAGLRTELAAERRKREETEEALLALMDGKEEEFMSSAAVDRLLRTRRNGQKVGALQHKFKLLRQQARDAESRARAECAAEMVALRKEVAEQDRLLSGVPAVALTAAEHPEVVLAAARLTKRGFFRRITWALAYVFVGRVA